MKFQKKGIESVFVAVFFAASAFALEDGSDKGPSTMPMVVPNGPCDGFKNTRQQSKCEECQIILAKEILPMDCPPDCSGKCVSRCKKANKKASKRDTKAKKKCRKFVAVSDTFEVNFLHINDHHSHMESDGFDILLDPSRAPVIIDPSTGDNVESVETDLGGFPRLISLIQELETSLPNVLKLHAGDAVTGTKWWTLFHGEVDAHLMNMVGFDAFEIGNHEFDDGDAPLAKFLDYLNNGTDKHFTPVLAANVVPGADSPLGAGFSGHLQPFTVLDVNDGTCDGDGCVHKLGVIGINVQKKTMDSSSPSPGTVLLDETKTAQKYIDWLRSTGIKTIVLLTHHGYDEDVELAHALRGVDVIVGGDSHTLLGEKYTTLGLSPKGPMPTVTSDLSGRTVCIVQAWDYAKVLGHLSVQFSREGGVSSCQGQTVAPIASTFQYENAAGNDVMLDESETKKVLDYISHELPMLRVVNPDADAAAYLALKSSEIAAQTEVVIGELHEPAYREYFPGYKKDGRDEAAVATYKQGSQVCNLVAQAFLWRVGNAQISVQNAGGCRSSLDAGFHTIADAMELLPFSNVLVYTEMTGTEILLTLEDALSNAIDKDVGDGSGGSYPYTAGLRFDVDASAAYGSRISNAQVQTTRGGAWDKLILGAPYTVVTQDYIGGGANNYLGFKKKSDADAWTNTHSEYMSTWVEWVDQELHGAVPVLEESLYSTQKYIGRDGCDHSTTTSCIGW